MIAAKMKPMLLPFAIRIALVCQSSFGSDAHVHVHDHLSNCICRGVCERIFVTS